MNKPKATEHKHVLEIKGITHGWTPDSSYSNLDMAKSVLIAAVNAGRKKTHVRIVSTSSIAHRATKWVETTYLADDKPETPKRRTKIRFEIIEQSELKPLFNPQKIMSVLNPWDRDNPTREATRQACKYLFPDFPVFVGGHHVAVHNPCTGNRMLLITCNSDDFN